MRIGVVSDTHNNLRNVRQIIDLFNEAGVSRVIHTGDISQAKTLHEFSRLDSPLFGVYGNNDQGELPVLDEAANELGFCFVQPPLELIWHNRRIVVVHDPLDLALVNQAKFDLVLHGHTHRQTILIEENRLTFNPGECAGMMTGMNAIGVVDLISLEPQILTF